MDHHCPECQANLRWRRLLDIKEGINGVRLHPPTTLCPLCKADLVRNLSAHESTDQALVFLCCLSQSMVGLSQSVTALRNFSVVGLMLLGGRIPLMFWLDRGWPRYVLRHPGPSNG